MNVDLELQVVDFGNVMLDIDLMININIGCI